MFAIHTLTTILLNIPANTAEQPIETKIHDKVPCSACTASTSHELDTNDDAAMFSILYVHDGDDLAADIELRLLIDGEYRTVVIDDAMLFDQETTSFEIVAGSDWSWGEVELVEVHLVPTTTTS